MVRVGWMQRGYEMWRHDWDMAHQHFWEKMAHDVAAQVCMGDEECFSHAMEVFYKELGMRRSLGRDDVRQFIIFVEGLAGAAGAPANAKIDCIEDPQGNGYSWT